VDLRDHFTICRTPGNQGGTRKIPGDGPLRAKTGSDVEPVDEVAAWGDERRMTDRSCTDRI
jgi:hypothetical protein